MKEKSLFELLKDIERLGYEVLTYEEGERLLNIVPSILGNYYVCFKLNNKKYFLFNDVSINLNQLLYNFIKKQKLNCIKNSLYYILRKNKEAL